MNSALPRTEPNSTSTAKGSLSSLLSRKLDSSIYPAQQLPLSDWSELVDCGVLLPSISREHGGSESHAEMCDLIHRIANHNLPIAMYTMIVTALFLRNITKYGSDALKEEVFPEFISSTRIGGFALTEPHCGSNLARMSTTYKVVENGYRIQGTKHWQAFSSTAHWWLVAARSEEDSRSFAYFVVRRDEGFRTAQKYNALGLKAIDYGLNHIDAVIPAHRRLEVDSDGLSGAIEMLCASRLSMCAMASGFTSRIHREARRGTKLRPIGHGALSDIPFVKYMLDELESISIINGALYDHLVAREDFFGDLRDGYFAAQCIKTLATDKMLQAALGYQQLSGGEGYRYNSPTNIAAFAALDARVYTVFDGTNDLLNCQVAEYCLREAGSEDRVNEFLMTYAYTRDAVNDVELTATFARHWDRQEIRVIAGRIISRVFGVACIARSREIGSLSAISSFKAIAQLNLDIKNSLSEMEHMVATATTG